MVIPAPGGLGVKEGFFALATQLLGSPVEALALAVAARVIMSLAETVALLFLCLLTIGPGSRRTATQSGRGTIPYDSAEGKLEGFVGQGSTGVSF